ncbi:ipis-1-like [Dermacentor albipictus]|uniref:ipis-1-like n=1 Tax=Dermacentor albipictus TaxID=60249 RepID=UPI0038FCAD84
MPGRLDNVRLAVNCCNSLGLDVYCRYTNAKPLENMFFSPYALAAGLSMTLAGARDATAEEIMRLMHIDRGLFETQREMVDLIRQLRNESGEVELRLATGAFVRLGYRPTDEYWATVRRVYGGTVHEVDFVEDSEMVRRQINSWVREHTDHQVKEILTPGSVTSATRLCIVNGVQFRAMWTDPFYETELRRHEFHATNEDEEGSEVEVEMVARIDEYGYIVDRDLCFTAVEVIQKGDKTSLVIVMPHQRHDFHVLEERQNLDKLLDLPKRMTRTPDVELCLPRLKLDMGLRLESILYYMGLDDLFSERANLSGMFGDGVNMHATEWVHHAVADMVNDPRKPRRYSFCSTGDSSPPDAASRSPEEELSPPPASALARRRSSTASRGSNEESPLAASAIAEAVEAATRRRGSGSATPPSAAAQPKTSCLKKEGTKTKARVRRTSTVRTTIPFVVNRPFIFYVLHRELSLLLFMGVVKRIA